MANAKIINYGQPIGAGTTVIPDNQVALDIESTDAKEYIQIDTSDSAEKLILAGSGATIELGSASSKTATGGAATMGAEGGSLTISTGDSTETAGHADADDLVIESDGNSGVNIISGSGSGTTNYGALLFGRKDGEWRGGLNYQHGSANDYLQFWTAGTLALKIDKDNKIMTGGETTPLCPAGGIHILTGAQTGGIVPGDGDDLVLESNAAVGMTMLGGSTSYNLIYFGKNGNPAAGYLGYLHAADGGHFHIKVAGYERLRINSAGKVGIGTTTAAAMLETKGNLGTALTGTFTATQGSAAISLGSSTAFLTELAVGSAIKIGSEIFTVAAIASNTALTLDSTFAGSTASGLSGTRDPDLLVVKTGDNKDKFIIDAEMSGQVKLASQSSGTEAALEIYDEANQVVRLSKVKSSYAALTWENGQELKFRTHTGVDVFNLGGTVVQAYKDVKLGSNADLALSSNHSGSTGGSVLIIENGSGAPSGALSNAIQLYSSSGELVVMDAGGSTTILSPHNFSLVERSEPMAWSMYSANAFVGKEINVDMLRVVRKLEELTGESFVSMRDLPEGECLDWDTEEQRHYDERQQRITEWESLSDDEKENTSAPESYAKKDKPSWLS